MKKITYACSLCRTEFRENARDNLIGFEWKTSAGQEYIVVRDISQVEHHLCKKCIGQIGESSLISRAAQ